MTAITTHDAAITEKPGRIHVIDVLRGFALLGIFLFHISTSFNKAPVFIPTKLDFVLNGFCKIFIAGKFYPIFSFLFGLSFIVQLRSAQAKGNKFLGRFLWRSVILFGIGYLHYMVYVGDVLRLYAILSLVLVLCYRLPNWFLVILGIVVIYSQVYILAMPHLPSILGMRVNMQYFMVLGAFFLGVAAAKANIFVKTASSVTLWKRIFWGSFAIALTCFVVIGYYKISYKVSGIIIVYQTIMGFFYVSGMVLLYWNTRLQKPLEAFTHVGRMGLTNYLVQSMFGAALFYQSGLGMAGKISTSYALLIGLIFFIAQVILSKLWMRRFYYGPAEWLWRSLTYLKKQPFLKKA